MPERPVARGRPRDESLDRAIIAAAAELLSEVGYEALTFADVAARAGTTRPALYRRHDSKADLAIAAIGALSESTAPRRSGDHLADLVAELTAFRDGIVAVSGVPMVGAMLHGSVDPEVLAAYRDRVVAPRRSRLRGILDAAAADGAITASPTERSDVVAMTVGAWYAMALAGDEPGGTWPRRTARLAWRALGGQTVDDDG
ncbi:MAG: helix-turn-helix domain-containing protein [Actinomycetota bacterium]